MVVGCRWHRRGSAGGRRGVLLLRREDVKFPEFTWWGRKLENIFTAAHEMFLLAGLVAVGVSAFGAQRAVARGALRGSVAEPSSLTIRGITSNALFLASLVSYVAAQFNIAISGGEKLSGWQALIFGPLGLQSGEFSWLANIFLLGAWLERKKPKTLPIAMVILALIFAGSYLLFPGGYGEHHSVFLGYWLWLASMVLVGASALTYVQPSAEVQSSAA